MKTFLTILLAFMFLAPLSAMGADTDVESNPAPPIKLQVDLDGSGEKTIDASGGAREIMKEYVGKIYKFGGGIVFVIAVIMVIVGGFEIMFKGGSGDIQTGKDRIMQALLGMVLLFLSALILHFVNPSFFV